MIAITLIRNINDSIEDARKIAAFLKPLKEVAPKVAIDLIPYNDNNLHGFQRPKEETINNFQGELIKEGFFVAVRITRGDEKSAACGMLATNRPKKIF